MAQMTTTELNKIEEDKRLRAMQYEKLLGDRAQLQQVIERLTPQVPDLQATLADLKAAEKLVARFPDFVVSVGRTRILNTGASVGPALAGGYILREVLTAQIQANIPTVERRLQDATEILGRAKVSLVAVEKELKKY